MPAFSSVGPTKCKTQMQKRSAKRKFKRSLSIKTHTQEDGRKFFNIWTYLNDSFI